MLAANKDTSWVPSLCHNKGIQGMLNSAYLTLIPKKAEALHRKDFLPKPHS